MKKPKCIKRFLWGIALAVALLLFSLPRQSIAQSDKNDSKKQIFKKQSDGSILQESTGLIWQATDAGKRYTHIKAIRYCDNLSVHGNSDWRLPAIEELKSLVDTSRKEPVTDPILNMAYRWYWSSTIYAPDTLEAWLVVFYDGYVGRGYLTSINRVRCVRSGN